MTNMRGLFSLSIFIWTIFIVELADALLKQNSNSGADAYAPNRVPLKLDAYHNVKKVNLACYHENIDREVLKSCFMAFYTDNTTVNIAIKVQSSYPMVYVVYNTIQQDGINVNDNYFGEHEYSLDVLQKEPNILYLNPEPDHHCYVKICYADIKLGLNNISSDNYGHYDVNNKTLSIECSTKSNFSSHLEIKRSGISIYKNESTKGLIWFDLPSYGVYIVLCEVAHLHRLSTIIYEELLVETRFLSIRLEYCIAISFCTFLGIIITIALGVKLIWESCRSIRRPPSSPDGGNVGNPGSSCDEESESLSGTKIPSGAPELPTSFDYKLVEPEVKTEKPVLSTFEEQGGKDLPYK